MSNSKTSINYQKITENVKLTDFNRDSDPESFSPDVEPPVPVELVDKEELERLLEAASGADESPDSLEDAQSNGCISLKSGVKNEIEEFLSQLDILRK